MKQGLRVVSLFNGISCGLVALKNLGIEIDSYKSSEIDKDAIFISEKNHLEIEEVGNVIGLKSEELGRVDLLLGGSPCQSFSRQGNGEGFDGKSGLFWEFVRVFEEVKPKFFLFENVEMKKEWEEIITEALGVKPIFLNSGEFSAQKRRRLYWTNIKFDPVKKNVLLKDILDKGPRIYDEKLNSLIVGKEGKSLLIKNATAKGYLIAEEFDGINLQFPDSKTRRGRVQSGKIGTLDTSCEYGVNIGGKISRLTISELEKVQGLPVGYTEGIAERKRKKAIGNGWQVDTIEQILKGLI